MSTRSSFFKDVFLHQPQGYRCFISLFCSDCRFDKNYLFTFNKDGTGEPGMQILGDDYRKYNVLDNFSWTLNDFFI